LREEKAAWEPVEGQQPKDGQLVNVTVTTIEDGQVADATAQPYEFVMGQGRAIPALEEQIMTLSPGETRDADLRYPEDHPDPARQGTTRQVRITLHGAKTQVLPPLDDAFAREIGDFEDVAALQAVVRTDLEREASRTSENQLREELVTKLAEANGVPAPHSLTHRLMHAYAEAYRVDPGQMEAFEQSFQPVAEAQVRRELIIEAVATAQNLQATEGDLDRKVSELAATRGVDAGKLYASLQQGNRLAELERSLTEDRVFEWLLQQSTVTESAS
jgi:trigger factor